YHKRIWLSVEVQEDGINTVKVGGIINKNQLSFDKEFDGLVAQLKLEAGVAETLQDNEED
ncbi:MAG: hypothetical protein KAS88_03045, partial [Deltaproteobacteria bacterium]|nr:hypothetical protein [Deltaproteobacteria bacterium]